MDTLGISLIVLGLALVLIGLVFEIRGTSAHIGLHCRAADYILDVLEQGFASDGCRQMKIGTKWSIVAHYG